MEGEGGCEPQLSHFLSIVELGSEEVSNRLQRKLAHCECSSCELIIVFLPMLCSRCCFSKLQTNAAAFNINRTELSVGNENKYLQVIFCLATLLIHES